MELSPKLYQFLVRPRWLAKIYIDNIISSSFDLQNKTVLDFGSGTGCCCTMCSPNNYLGVDIDRQRVNYARRLHPDYSFAVLQKNRLPVPENSVDYILIVAVLHHIPSANLPVYLQDYHRVLKPHGKILVMEPCFDLRYPFRNQFMAIFDKGKYIRHEPEYLALFERELFRTKVIKRYQKLLYNELFFLATPKY